MVLLFLLCLQSKLISAFPSPLNGWYAQPEMIAVQCLAMHTNYICNTLKFKSTHVRSAIRLYTYTLELYYHKKAETISQVEILLFQKKRLNFIRMLSIAFFSSEFACNDHVITVDIVDK